ncbi:uncharacterized protein LOC129595315 [Paramacrobiotus metropolitanus]|uniref:uncharacterized protein LOC129595315 n=1 Tax=Paramacrobiotus metropolitanus TaxID=2943436 RepID=UPI002445A913|nr:uncharacterized protein LOC129595315 [Paramacrobiotus metropolitanus]
MGRLSFCWTAAIVVFLNCLPYVLPTNRYYGTYVTYGFGDTYINTNHAHRGPSHPHRKWNVECLDGEAVIGIGDLTDDFQKLVTVWCRFTFPYKPFLNGLYPYYPDCWALNFTFQWHCYSPKYHDASVNSFVTGFWDEEISFFVFRPFLDNAQPYKCCKTPQGYYIDYMSCYYMPTRDQYGEYYDSSMHMLVYCASGYVVTGLAKKMSVWTKDYHIEWIHCCRVGYGAVPDFKRLPSSGAYSYGSYANTSQPGRPTAAYADQYNMGNLGAQALKRGYAGGQAHGYDQSPYTSAGRSLGPADLSVNTVSRLGSSPGDEHDEEHEEHDTTTYKPAYPVEAEVFSGYDPDQHIGEEPGLELTHPDVYQKASDAFSAW